MPAYPWLMQPLSLGNLQREVATLAQLGIPYDDDRIDNAERDALAQSQPDNPNAAGLLDRYGENINVRAFDGDPARLTEMDALVAYLQSLGTLTGAAHEAAQEDAE